MFRKNIHVFIIIAMVLPVVFLVHSVLSYHEMEINEEELSVGGLLGYDIPLENIDTIMLLDNLPVIWAAGGLEYQNMRKGHFLRTLDHKQLNLVTHHEDLFIKIITKDVEIFYYNTERIRDTKILFDKLKTIQLR